MSVTQVEFPGLTDINGVEELGCSRWSFTRIYTRLVHSALRRSAAIDFALEYLLEQSRRMPLDALRQTLLRCGSHVSDQNVESLARQLRKSRQRPTVRAAAAGSSSVANKSVGSVQAITAGALREPQRSRRRWRVTIARRRSRAESRSRSKGDFVGEALKRFPLRAALVW